MGAWHRRTPCGQPHESAWPQSRPRRKRFATLASLPLLRHTSSLWAGRHSSAVPELLRLIEMLKELHTEVQGMISSPHLATTLLFDVSRRWNLYLNRCVAVFALETLDAPGCQVPFSLEPILAELEGGRYVGPILPPALGDLVSKANGRGGGDGDGSCGGGSGNNGGGSGGGGGNRGCSGGNGGGGVMAPPPIKGNPQRQGGMRGCGSVTTCTCPPCMA